MRALLLLLLAAGGMNAAAQPPVPFREGDPWINYETNTHAMVYEWLNVITSQVAGKPDEFTPSADKVKYAYAVNDALAALPNVAVPLKCDVAYNADQRTFAVTHAVRPFGTGVTFVVSGGLPFAIEGVWPLRIIASQQTTSTTTYEASNRNGATIQVTKTVEDVGYVSFGKLTRLAATPTLFPPSYVSQVDNRLLGYSSADFTMKLTVPMPPEDARRMKPNLRCGLVLKFEWPGVLLTREESLPTFNFPHHTVTNGRAIYGHPVSFVAYDGTTGAALATGAVDPKP